MTQPAGKTLPLTPARRYMGGLLKDARRVPTVTIRRTLRMGPTEAGASWCAVFTRAYGIVAAARPELRRVHVDWPWPRCYERSENVAAVAVERQCGGEVVVCFAHLRQPQNLSVREIDEELRRVREAPLETAREARGTFGVTGEGGSGVALLNVLTPLTTTLTCGPGGLDGTVEVRLTFDQRILDGATAAKVLRDLQRVLRTEGKGRG